MKVLKFCPFCGGAAHIWEDGRLTGKSHDFPKFYISCNGCGIRTPVGKLEQVVRMWNMRVGEIKNE